MYCTHACYELLLGSLGAHICLFYKSSELLVSFNRSILPVIVC